MLVYVEYRLVEGKWTENAKIEAKSRRQAMIKLRKSDGEEIQPQRKVRKEE